MQETREKWVTICRPGAMFNETERRRVDIDTTPEQFAELILPYEFGFQMEIVHKKTVNVEGEVFTREEVVKDPANYYVNGEVMTADELQQRFPEHGRLIHAVIGSKFKQVIRCQTGNWCPFDKRKDKNIIVPRDG
ncbi:hypothetical protein EHM76_04575, partial [bacterium]